MENKDLKNIFRQELAGHKVYIDKDDLWAGIQKKKKKRVGFYFWIGLGSLALILGLGIWNYIGDSSSDLNKLQTAPSNLKEKESTIAKNLVRTNDNIKKEISQISIPPASAKNNEEGVVSKNKNSKLEKKTISVDEVVIGSQVESVATVTSPFEVRTMNQSGEYDTTQKPNDAIIKESIAAVEEVILNAKGEIGADIAELTIVAILDQVNTPISQSEGTEEEVLFAEKLDTIVEANDHLISDALDEDGSSNVSVDSPKKSFRFEMIPQFEYGIPIKTIESRKDLQNEIDILRNEIETPLENWSVGLSIQANHKTGIYVAAGLRFDQLQEKVEFTERSQDLVLQNDVIVKRVLLADGSSSDIIGDAAGTRLSSNLYNVYNTYRRWSAPLTFGYEKNWQNWAVDGGVNFIFNLNHRFKGYILEYNDANENHILIKNANVFKNRLDMDTRLMIGISYKFSKIKIRLSPFVQLNESQILKADSQLRQTYRYYGVSLGLRL